MSLIASIGLTRQETDALAWLTFDRLSQVEIAERLGVTVGAARQILYRAKRKAVARGGQVARGRPVHGRAA